jgi:hypothetical protein
MSSVALVVVGALVVLALFGVGGRRAGAMQTSRQARAHRREARERHS